MTAARDKLRTKRRGGLCLSTRGANYMVCVGLLALSVGAFWACGGSPSPPLLTAGSSAGSGGVNAAGGTDDAGSGAGGVSFGVSGGVGGTSFGGDAAGGDTAGAAGDAAAENGAGGNGAGGNGAGGNGVGGGHAGGSQVGGGAGGSGGSNVHVGGAGGMGGSPPACWSGPCPPACGDGIVNGTEACDDGNLLNNDGCSSACTTEPGFTCSVAPCVGTACAIALPAVFRDFNSSGVNRQPDFEPALDNQTAIVGLVQPDLNGLGKPVYSGAPRGNITSVASFAEWYTDTPGVNATTLGQITLWSDGAGGWVNRWGAQGQQWVGYPGLVTYCSNTGCADPACAVLNSEQTCSFPCVPWGGLMEACIATTVHYDGSPVFFPIDQSASTLTDTRYAATIPTAYGFPYASEALATGVSTPPLHNFDFTTEVRLWFVFDPNASNQISFTGDDDAWVFVNGRLAVDLGGWHPPLEGSVILDSTSAAKFGLVAGNSYAISVFHAERKRSGSTFRLSLHGFDLTRSRCSPN